MIEFQSPPSLDLTALRALSVIGRGAKGVVFSVRCNDEEDGGGSLLALKAISRSFVEEKDGKVEDDAYRRIRLERDVLLALRHPLLPSLRGVVSTDSIVGFAIDLCSGGDLNSLRHRQTEKMFSNEMIRFYAAEMVLALEYLHGLGFVYRDLKPDNIMIQENGHLMLVDFDLSAKLLSRSPDPMNKVSEPPSPSPRRVKRGNNHHKIRFFSCFSCNAGVSPEILEPEPVNSRPVISPTSVSESGKSNSFVGTEEYVAPEIISGGGHDFAVDWWSLGVVLYEMLYGRTPFRGQNRKETFYRILSKEPELTGEKTPLRDLISRLLVKDPGSRIACDAVKAHAFFRGVDWESILLISRPPFIPEPPPEIIDAVDVEKVVREVSNGSHAAPPPPPSEEKRAEDAGRACTQTGAFKDF